MWLPGGNMQTIWPALVSKSFAGDAPVYKRERWNTPDGDFIDIDWLVAPVIEHRPIVVLFHGLEGSSRSHYAEAFADFARAQQLSFVVPHFRGCGGELNLGPRAYHSGDYEEIDWILKRLRRTTKRPIIVVGVSLGGNALLRWVQESGAVGSQTIAAAAAVSSPLDLTASGNAIGRGFNRLLYTRMFLYTMKPKALAKLRQHPGLFDGEALIAAKDLHTFDNIFTAPLHGYKDVGEYWLMASSKPHLKEIKLPTLLVNACNDPFVPFTCLPVHDEVGPWVTLWQPRTGGHVGFPSGRFPGNVLAMPSQVGCWLLQNTNTGGIANG
jgi:predicted alpha/beta-fold hydrolase